MLFPLRIIDFFQTLNNCENKSLEDRNKKNDRKMFIKFRKNKKREQFDS